ncbi:MAG: hypothetical protein ACXW28_01835 [Thermoanaerobaculia bacterium]
MKRILTILALMLLAIPALAATFGNGGPRTTNNDDSCDIAVLPAATLLLPYFEVNTETPSGQTTLFTITNVTNVDQVARVTLWTDYGFPVISFNIYLTGYDVQSINLFDIIERGIIAPDSGTGSAVTDRGHYSDVNPSIDFTKCDRLPGLLDDIYLQRMQNAFILGKVPPIGDVLPACDPVGREHVHATGYATIDVVGNCDYFQPHEEEYFKVDIRYDNVLTGDYQQVDSAQNYAQANPLVHIRAMPEGGTPSSRRTGAENRVNFERTFYDRYAPATHNDGRQPLPSTFAARWILGGPTHFETFYKIWREVPTGADAECQQYADNDALPVAEVIVFDENENFAAAAPFDQTVLGLPGTSILSWGDGNAMPQMTNGAVSGWTYFNLDITSDDDEATQNWVIVSMRSHGRYSVDFDATALGNGCSAERGASEVRQEGGITIGPAPNANP